MKEPINSVGDVSCGIPFQQAADICGTRTQSTPWDTLIYQY